MVILGSTGSIGTNALKICKEQNIEIEALACGKNYELLNRQIKEFKPKFVCINEPNFAKKIQHNKIFIGKDGVLEMLELCKSDKVINAFVGFTGLEPSLAIQNLGKTLALANKESLVVAGKFLKCNEIIAIDSEHFGLNFLQHAPSKPKKLIITASGGAFFKTPLKALKTATANDALKHPNWSMGSKITIDSATMANKLFEILEAFWLYSTKNIDAIIEPKSLIHAFIEFEDGSSSAHISIADMKLAIAHAILEKPKNIVQNLDLNQLCNLNLIPINLKKYPIFGLKDRLLENPDLGVVVNAANEIMVYKFLNNKCGFMDISKAVIKAFTKFDTLKISNITDIFEADKEVRKFTQSLKI